MPPDGINSGLNNSITKKSSPNKLAKTLLFAIAGILLIVAVYYFSTQPTKKPVTEKIPPKEVRHIAVEYGKLPEGLPPDLPMEKDALILQNYTTGIIDTSKYQATRAYKSKKTVDENYAIFTDYFVRAGWDIYSESKQRDVASIFAKKDITNLAGNMSVIIGQNETNSEVTVTINYIYDGKNYSTQNIPNNTQ